MAALARFSPNRRPLRLKGLNFKEFFEWLSRSVSRVSRSTPGDTVKLDLTGLDGWAESRCQESTTSRGRGHLLDGTPGQDRTGYLSRGGVQAMCLADGAASPRIRNTVPRPSFTRAAGCWPNDSRTS